MTDHLRCTGTLVHSEYTFCPMHDGGFRKQLLTAYSVPVRERLLIDLLQEEHSVHPADQHLKISQQKCRTCHENYPCGMAQKLHAILAKSHVTII